MYTLGGGSFFRPKFGSMQFFTVEAIKNGDAEKFGKAVPPAEARKRVAEDAKSGYKNGDNAPIFGDVPDPDANPVGQITKQLAVSDVVLSDEEFASLPEASQKLYAKPEVLKKDKEKELDE